MLQSVERQPGGHWAGAQLGFHQDVPRNGQWPSWSFRKDQHWATRLPVTIGACLMQGCAASESRFLAPVKNPLSGLLTQLTHPIFNRKLLRLPQGPGRPVESSHGRANEAWWHGATEIGTSTTSALHTLGISTKELLHKAFVPSLGGFQQIRALDHPAK